MNAKMMKLRIDQLLREKGMQPKLGCDSKANLTCVFVRCQMMFCVVVPSKLRELFVVIKTRNS